ncbi:P27 family phage terminase small subunit [Clostridium sp. 'deep sea']|uniref:P27 family phage terminase small subunit n=1 Tax=Clostridium sp. 'deep sea' TaxID=2779445 RepID=UPI00189684EB|nr:P27 family phage terminase small subunit [Clostridium sp. 'deep sea']QOR34434.1 P27 family phage terminase small subunit [Clostridium sp. 'deep sea']
MAIIPTRETIKRSTITAMRELGIHKKQYNRLITLYADLVYQYLTINDKFEKDGYEYEVFTAQGGVKKAPIVATLETLRKDILAYSDRLCLNPKSLETVTADSNKKSVLASVLSKLE